ncbi:hypothetical protein [Cystobacter fuscus]|uniref:hypothetical protein n=1 Tax=Cystobacter fuscus TaxID=43 RepID=UPI002B303F14|nr:hypothetical protein F0U63_33045 [Cystobacter fuscus]
MGFFWRASILVLAAMALSCASPTRRCRSYATQYLSSGEGITNGYSNIQTPIRVDCEFDREFLEKKCTAHYLDQYARPSVHTQTVRYASLRDFVEEPTPVGRVRAIYVQDTYDGFDSGTSVAPYLLSRWQGETSYVYDSAGRLTSHDVNAWDQAGRPRSQSPTDICTSDTGNRLVYDDTARTVTLFYNTRTSTRPPDNTVPCIPASRRWTFDENGNTTSYGLTEYAVQEVEEICVDVED